MKTTFAILNQMRDASIIGDYAIGGAVGATFYLEPVATLDVDVFVIFSGSQFHPLLSLTPIYDYLLPLGFEAEGEYIRIGDWLVQFLPPSGPLEEEAIRLAQTNVVENISVRVMEAEHLVAIALSVGRAKDFSRILQFIEEGILNLPKLDDILNRHNLQAKWESFVRRFLTPDPT